MPVVVGDVRKKEKTSTTIGENAEKSGNKPRSQNHNPNPNHRGVRALREQALKILVSP